MRYYPQGYNQKLGIGVTGEDSEYDSCHYEVLVDPAILEKWNPKKLNVKITSKSAKANAYIYEGRTKKEATKSLTTGND